MKHKIFWKKTPRIFASYKIAFLNKIAELI